MALKQVKNKILATKKTSQVTKAMEAVSAVKMRKSQERALSGKAYAEAALRVLHRVSQSRESAKYFATRNHNRGKECFIVITSDKGLAGNLNSAVLKEVSIALSEQSKEDVRIIAFGKKAYEHFLSRGYVVDAHYTNVSDDVGLADMYEVVQDVVEKFTDGTYAKVSVAYQNFVSTFEQYALLRQILPLDTEVLEVMVRDITPKRGKYSERTNGNGGQVYTVEPSVEEVMNALIPQLVQIMLYHAMLESKASEHSARMVAMKNATDKAKEIIRDLTIAFNKERQAEITAEVSEITGGIEAMSQRRA